MVMGREPAMGATLAAALGGSTFRNDLDPEYKAGRREMPDLFRGQLPLIGGD